MGHGWWHTTARSPEIGEIPSSDPARYLTLGPHSGKEMSALGQADEAVGVWSYIDTGQASDLNACQSVATLLLCCVGLMVTLPLFPALCSCALSPPPDTCLQILALCPWFFFSLTMYAASLLLFDAV